MCSTRSPSRKEPATERASAAGLALILAAHGETGVRYPNRALGAHADALKDSAGCLCTGYGVLNGEPDLTAALAQAVSAGAEEFLIYPFFMSDGYFVKQLLPEKLAAAGVEDRARVLPPLGHDPGIAGVMMGQAIAAAENAGFAPAKSRLLVIGHGSKSMPASARATRRISRDLDAMGKFMNVEVAFLEEPPFLLNALAAHKGECVVSGFFASNGIHSTHDVPGTLEETGSPAVYSGPVGVSAEVRKLVVEAVRRHTTS